MTRQLQAAERSGDAARARYYYAKLVENRAVADTNRVEVAQAKAYLAKH